VVLSVVRMSCLILRVRVKSEGGRMRVERTKIFLEDDEYFIGADSFFAKDLKVFIKGEELTRIGGIILFKGLRE